VIGITDRLLYYKKYSSPSQTGVGTERSRNFRFPNFMTTAHNGGKRTGLMHWPPLTPGNTPGTHLC